MQHKKITQDLGSLKGKLLVFGGVYSNLQALESLQAIAENENIPPQQVICTGDVVGYCAAPELCVQRIIKWGIHCIAGNVEIQLREGEEDCGCNFDEAGRCNLFSKQWYPYAQSHLSESSIEWMKTLPDFLQFQYANHTATVLHGSYHETAEFIFRSTNWLIKANNFSASQSDLILAGHCGLPFYEMQAEKIWLNAGVIGMPANDGTTRVWYIILDDNDGKLNFKHHHFEYNHQLAAQKMRENHLPATYANTLETGIWDNCEILPVEETAMQGKTIVF